MRQALVMGVATKIYVEKYNRYHLFSKEELLGKLKDDLNLNLYEILEDMEYVIFVPKNELFVKHIGNLLETETLKMRMDLYQNMEIKQFLECLKNIKNATDFKEVLIQSSCSSILYVHGRSGEDISYIYSGKEDITIFADMISLGYCNHFYMECPEKLFCYLIKKIRKTIDTPLKDNIFFMLKNFDDFGREAFQR